MRITIVGAGFCGTALVQALSQRAPDEALDITLVGNAATFGRGVAYGAARPEHCLNVRAGELGLDPAQPGGFAEWLASLDAARADFLPRQLYGEYLSRQLGGAAIALNGRLHLVPEDAISLERDGTGFRVFLADGSDHAADAVILAVGALPPQNLTMADSSLVNSRGYVAWPWAEGALDGIESEASVLVVGTGLTMVDTVLTLRNNGHHGPIEAISRHGLLPHVHGPRWPAAPMPATLARAVAGGRLHEVLRALRQLARVADDWRTLVDALRPHTRDLWHGFTPAERGRFMRHLRSTWEVHRHRIAPDVARDLAALEADGQLSVRAARLLHARWRGKRVEAWLRYRGEYHAQPGRHDVLVRATGLDTDIGNSRHPLVSHLRDAGLLQRDPLGLGVVADARDRVVDARGQPVPGLYAIGPLLRGRDWECTAIPELRRAAWALAEELGAEAAARRGHDAAQHASPAGSGRHWGA